MATSDQGFREFKSKLITSSHPYNPFAPRGARGDEDDPARYVLEPGANFMRPWLAIRGGQAFQWPLGVEGFTLSIDPTLGIHKYIGDNAVAVEVIHAGEEHFTMQGSFPGNSAPDLVAALRDIVYQGASDEGKLLWLPEIVTFVQRVHVVNFQATRAQDGRGRDMDYSIEMVRMGVTKVVLDPVVIPANGQPVLAPKGKSTRVVKADMKHNTLRKIAAWKLGNKDKWRAVYNLNVKWFVDHKVPIAKAPDYRLPVGTAVHY